MEIETKFNHGGYVYALITDRIGRIQVKAATITQIKINIASEKEITFKYTLVTPTCEIINDIDESVVFPDWSLAQLEMQRRISKQIINPESNYVITEFIDIDNESGEYTVKIKPIKTNGDSMW